MGGLPDDEGMVSVDFDELLNLFGLPKLYEGSAASG